MTYAAEPYCEFQDDQSLNLYFIHICESSKNAIISKYILGTWICVCLHQEKLEKVAKRKC